MSRAWRTSFDAAALADDPARAISTGPYKISDVVPDGRVELVRNDRYTGPSPAAFDTVVVRSDLHPLDAVEALADGEADVVAPLDTPDVLDALGRVDDAVVRTGGDSTLQLQLQVAGGGAFDPATYDGDAAVASAVRRAFLRAVPRDSVVADAVEPLWSDAAVSDAMLPAVGPESGEVSAPASADVDAAAELLADAGVTTPVVVRVLTNGDDPVRHQLLDALTVSAGQAGFTVEPYEPDLGVAADLLGAPETWDVALVPVPQGDLPVASVVARWRTQGATNVTGWSDPALDAALDTLAAGLGPAQVAAGGKAVAQALADGGAALSVVRSPVVVATRQADPETADRLPTVPAVTPLTLGRADLTSWWAWARTAGS
ncbi:ABC-type transport system substrate-binding protein [Cellulomonas sp. URHB0016]